MGDMTSAESTQSGLSSLTVYGRLFSLSAAGKSCLRVASTGGHLDCVHSLVTYGADVTYIDMEGRPIIYVLAVENRPDAIRILHDAGAGTTTGAPLLIHVLYSFPFIRTFNLICRKL